jgi:hypothetical protein
MRTGFKDQEYIRDFVEESREKRLFGGQKM